MAYTQEELQKVKDALADFTKVAEDAIARANAMREEFENKKKEIEKATDACNDYLKRKDQEYMEKYGMTCAEYNALHKDEINEYILSHPEEFGDDPSDLLVK